MVRRKAPQLEPQPEVKPQQPSDKLLIAVVSCHKRRAWTDAQRTTWVKDVPPELGDVRFFVGRGDGEDLSDQVVLDVEDTYEALPEKVRAVCQWACDADYQQMLKMDDDTLLWPMRIVRPKGLYVGWKQEPVEDNWCSGLAYWLLRPAMEAVARAELNATTSEDRWVGKVLKHEGIRAEQDRPRVIQWVGRSRPLPQHVGAILMQAYVAGEFKPEEMPQLYVY